MYDLSLQLFLHFLDFSLGPASCLNGEVTAFQKLIVCARELYLPVSLGLLLELKGYILSLEASSLFLLPDGLVSSVSTFRPVPLRKTQSFMWTTSLFISTCQVATRWKLKAGRCSIKVMGLGFCNTELHNDSV